MLDNNPREYLCYLFIRRDATQPGVESVVYITEFGVGPTRIGTILVRSCDSGCGRFSNSRLVLIGLDNNGRRRRRRFRRL